MRLNYTTLLLPALLWAICIPLAANAQGQADVTIDMSVLEKLDPEPEIPAIPLYPEPVPGIEAPDKAPRRFPVRVNTRSESIDPSLNVSDPVKETANDIIRPHTKPSNPVARPPIPPRRPEIQRASSSFVERARARIRQEGPKVNAAPAEPVKAVPLEAPEPDSARLSLVDDVMKQIERIDKQKLIDTIENIMADQAGGTSVPKHNATAPVRRIKPEQGSTPRFRQAVKNIPKPPQKPLHMARAPQTGDKGNSSAIRDITADNAIAYKMAAVEPAAIDITARLRPKARANPYAGDSDDAGYHEKKLVLPMAEGQETIDEQAIAALRKEAFHLLNAHPNWRLQINAYATPQDDTVSSARRISLARALSVRAYLLDLGIDAARMDIKALGEETGNAPPDRTDLIFVDPEK